MNPHKHQAMIVLWAQGYKLQSRQNQYLPWTRAAQPSFGLDWYYRVDPDQS